MEIMKNILPLLSLVFIINTLGSSGAGIREDISGFGDGNFIEETTIQATATVADEVALLAHNVKRVQHGVPLLIFNATV
ncbi:unnamed protein product, partial [Allacma fusca]